MALGGAFLRFGQTGLRILEFCCAAIVLGVYSYFLAVLSRHDMTIPTWEKAVEGMAGAATLYTIFGVLLTLCLGGIKVLAFVAIFLDICFAGCFAAIAYYTRHGANRCSGLVNTPLGNGLATEPAPGAGDWGYVCSLNTACFAVSIGAIFLFLVTACLQFLLARHHQKEKRFGPSPSNNYTKGSRTPFWRRNRKTHPTRDAEMATGAAPTAGHGFRHSNETGMTGSTMHGGHMPATSEPKYGQPGYGMNGYAAPNATPTANRF
ncbi:uncharacterized protein A1O9_09744 [Exophiala aquamarina CBS 119918]|uniref:MARVEL domain-containing protein n=1 Tax=Exophiala aquamarina CBS 119918 TaxID=1182545 RepID=A0A072P1F0_9EURO|nr:uncharacterized protein A1O9_09744 [Exophiala aquamarina CBS 119918]KEF53949.1 hypothetical protein A1O9_09744 [Exophiala aquamarina CBS 119918]